MIIRRATIISVKEDNKTDSYLAVIHMLKSQLIAYDEIVDQMLAIKLGRGKLNPSGPGFVVLLPGYQLVFDCIALAGWIEREGLKLL